MITHKKKKLFISFEGIDGSGKSTLAQCLYEKLIQVGCSALLTAEPTSQRFGRLIQEWILFSENPLSKEEQILLFTADRLEHSHMIKRMLEKECVVITDRFIDSTMAYQGSDERSVQLIKQLQIALFCDVIPTITFLLDIDPETSLKRIQRKKDQFEAIQFLTEVRKRYQNIALENKERVIILDSKEPIGMLEKKMWECLEYKGLLTL